jgi:uncharacterized protein
MSPRSYFSEFIFCILAPLLGILNLSAQTPVQPLDSVLLHALVANDQIAVAKSLTNGANPNSVDDDSDNALMYAAMYADTICMNLLVEHHANIEQRNKAGETALMWCADEFDKIKWLLRHDANINAVSNGGNNLLLIACRAGFDQYDIVKFLIDQGADCNISNQIHENALMKAAVLCDTNMLSMLYSKRIDILAIGPQGMSALTLAVFHENFDAAFWILHHLPNQPQADTIISNTLTYAVDCNNTKMVKELADRAKNIDWEDGDGYTALMWAVYNEHPNKEMIDILIKHGARVKHKGKDGKTPMSWALTKGNTEIVSMLSTVKK